jgi:hypothetical protein
MSPSDGYLPEAVFGLISETTQYSTIPAAKGILESRLLRAFVSLYPKEAAHRMSSGRILKISKEVKAILPGTVPQKARLGL